MSIKSIEKRVVETKGIWSLRGRVLVIAEKPKAADKIAHALSNKFLKMRHFNIPYYLIRGDGLEIIVASAAGHLFGLYSEERGYPVFRYVWKPLYEIDKSARHTYKFLKLLEKLCRESNYYVNACDYDIEGSVIGYLIIKSYGDVNRSFRAKFSSLTREDLVKAFNNLTQPDHEMIEAGLCRHELDWLWGINISRALMDAVKKIVGRNIVLSAGRVQTPTLKHVVENNIMRKLFIPLPQYSLLVDVMKDGKRIHLEYGGSPIENKMKALEYTRMIKETGYLIITRYEEKKQNIHPPPAFNLGDLQSEAARIYGYSPYKTQSIAEKLYLDALISYPRTNSQKLPSTINYREIIEKLRNITTYSSLVDQLVRETSGVLKPVQGEKDDPAHPAIYPTGVKPTKLSEDEWRIYDLIVRRFLATFSEPAILSLKTVSLKHPSRDELVFQANGRVVVDEGWFRYYPFLKPDEKYLPRFNIGEKVSVIDAKVRKSYTKPPEKITKIKLLKWMEREGIGTESTRARIIELLFKRGYLKNVAGASVVTDIGFGVIEVLDEHFPDLTSVKLTRYFEEEMEKIREGVRKREDVVAEARDTIKRLLISFDQKKSVLGELLCIRLGYISPREKCLICGREAWRNNLCKYHYRALENLVKNYEVWRSRENVDWKEYINALKSLKITGEWVRDVIKNVNRIDLSNAFQ